MGITENCCPVTIQLGKLGSQHSIGTMRHWSPCHNANGFAGTDCQTFRILTGSQGADYLQGLRMLPGGFGNISRNNSKSIF